MKEDKQEARPVGIVIPINADPTRIVNSKVTPKRLAKKRIAGEKSGRSLCYWHREHRKWCNEN